MVSSDSQYLLGIILGKRPRATEELAARLRQAIQRHMVQTTKVLAHSASP